MLALSMRPVAALRMMTLTGGLLLAACTTTVEPQIIDGNTVTETYDLTLTASPLNACSTGDGTTRVAAITLRGSDRLIVELITSAAVTLRPPGVCENVSGACGHYAVTVDGKTLAILLSSSVVEIPLASLGTHTFQVALVDDDGAPLYTPARQEIKTPVISVEVVEAGSDGCP